MKVTGAKNHTSAKIQEGSGRHLGFVILAISVSSEDIFVKFGAQIDSDNTTFTGARNDTFSKV